MDVMVRSCAVHTLNAFWIANGELVLHAATFHPDLGLTFRFLFVLEQI